LPSASIPKVPPLPSLLITPVSCPPCISFFTLPELYIWTDWIKGRPGYRFGRNLVPSGNFDDPDAIVDSDWVNVSYQLEGVVGKIRTVPRSGCDLRLMSSVKDVSGIPMEGDSLLVVAVVDHVLHFRIFDGYGKMVVDTNAKKLTKQAQRIEDLSEQLESLWPPHELTESEKDRVVTSVSSIVGHTPRSEANGKTGNPKILSADELSLDNSRSNRVVKMVVSSEKPEDLDLMIPFLDFPVAAIRSPSIPVEANNLIRISVLVRRAWPNPAGMGGIIVRDSIGGEQFQFRTSGTIPAFSRVVLFRKAPAAGTFNVTLGLAGYGEAYFDDFRVEVIEEAPVRGSRPVDPGLAGGRQRSRTSGSPALPDPTLPASASRPVDSPR